MPVDSVIQLSCSCNQYPWGKQGHESIAARLCEKTPGWDGEKADKQFKIDDKTSYAEMYACLRTSQETHLTRLAGGWVHTLFFPHM